MIAALLCVVSIAFLAKEITSAGQRIHSVGSIRLVNFSFMVGRNFDELARALSGYRDCRLSPDQLPSGASNAEYIEKFDIVWSAYKSAYRNIYKHWSSTGYWLDEGRATSAARLRDSGLAFVDKYQADMSPDSSIGCDRINKMLNDIFSQKEGISEFAQSYFDLDNRAAAEQQAGIKKLYHSILFLAVSFLATLMLAAALVYKAMRETGESYRQSQVAGQKAMVALRELRESVNTSVAQQNFFAAASHDLRQPLHALGLYLGSLRRHVSTADARHILNCATLSTESLSGLLDSLLDISKLDAGVIESNNEEFDIHTLLTRIHRRFLPEAKEKSLELICESDDSRVFTDEQLLDRILQNLISNALTYTNSGRITIASTRVKDHVVVTVTDTGSGIPELKQEAVFTEFYQLRNKERDRGKGLGLGLSIVRRLSDLLEVELEMESEEGKGTRFSIRLPAVKNFQTASLNKREPETKIALESSLTGVKILVVDDEEDIRDSTVIVLQGWNCTVRAAEDIDSALQIVSTEGYSPDLILADYRLREQKTGVQAVEALRHVIGSKVPAIIVTGDTSVDFLTRASLTNLDVLYKPVETKDLLMRIVRMVTSNDPSGKKRLQTST